ncbi:MAG: efflux RND transporter permease subunit [Chitinophagales bacterium]|jgi:multidrug efflux pump|nr:efflux RND transporter permease subunit [Chitinophagales bacterium]
MKAEKLKELGFTSWCIDNATSIYVFTFMILFSGLAVYNSLPKELFPDVVVPTISVATIYPGATPSDIENLITKPIEKQVKSLNGVKKITSNSLSDVSIITVEFSTDLKPADCKQKVTDAVAKGKKDLPTDLKTDPQIQEFDINELPIMNINLAGDLPLDQIKGYGEDLKDKIESMKEITRVDIVGGMEREIQINVDLYKMTSAGISFMDIENAVQRENLNVSGGEVRVDDLRRNLRVTGEFKDPKELENLIVRSFTGTTVFLKNIATIEDGFKDKQDFAQLDRKSVVTLNVVKRSGENLISATDQIYKVLEEYQTNKFPKGLKVKVTGDTSENTRIQLHDLLNTVILGFIFVVFILMFFMGFTNAFFVGLSVPLATLVAFLFMPGLGMTMNVMVLFSLLLALGIVVDDAIVVIENTHRIYHKYEYDIKQSAKYAAGEVFIPVLAGTLTTLAPFFPLLFWPGIVGKFMKNLPITLIITLGASLFVAFVMNPVFAVSFMKKEEHGDSKLKDYKWGFIGFAVMALFGYITGSMGIGNFAVFCILLILLYHFVFHRSIIAWQTKLWPKVGEVYRNILRAFIQGKRPIAVVLSSVALLVISWVIFFLSKPDVVFFPSGDPNFVYVYCKLPSGTDAEVTDSVTRIIEQRVYKVIGSDNPDVTSVISNVGLAAGDPQNPDKVPTPNKSKVTVAFKKFADRKEPKTSIWLEKVQKEFKREGIVGAEISVEPERNGPPVGKPINIEITGDDYATLATLSTQLKSKIAASGIQGIDELKSDLQISKPEIIIDLDKEKMQREGISLGQVAVELRTALFGKEVSKFRDVEDDAPIQLRLRAEDRTSVEKLMNVYISYMDFSTGSFRQVPISSIARIRYDNTISVINRKNQNRVVTLASDVSSGYNANNIIPEIQEVINNMDFPEGYEAKMTGEQEQQAETGAFLGVAFGGALALMLLIMVVQFNSVVKPLIIFTTVFFSLIGVSLGFAFTGMKFSVVMSGVGVFALAGIVIRNGILLIEFIDELRDRGENVYDAVVDGGATRMTPVILTASAAILGLIPLAIGLNMDFETLFSHFDAKFYLGGDNVKFWGPLSWTMIFGLIVATFLTLLVVPTMYMLGYKTREWVKRKLSKVSA